MPHSPGKILNKGTIEFVVLLNRQDVYIHLLALCDQDLRFGIMKAAKEEDLEALTVSDVKEIDEVGGLKGTIIGTLRLLPMNDKTLVMFLDKDAGWHMIISKEGKTLFVEFFKRAWEHFDNLGLIERRKNVQVKQPTAPVVEGDFVGRDKIIYSDEVHGDKIWGKKVEVGNITGSAPITIASGDIHGTQKPLPLPKVKQKPDGKGKVLVRQKDTCRNNLAELLLRLLIALIISIIATILAPMIVTEIKQLKGLDGRDSSEQVKGQSKGKKERVDTVILTMAPTDTSQPSAPPLLPSTTPITTAITTAITTVFTPTLVPILTSVTVTPTPVLLLERIKDGKDVDMKLIPAGEFQMGSSLGLPNERPGNPVYLDAYYFDIYEVTNAQYGECVNDGGCKLPGSSCNYFGYPAYAKYPVGCVDWTQAQIYCAWRGGNLPTEAQWEMAARGGMEGKAYPWGDETPSCQKDSINGAQFSGCPGDTMPVGSFLPNGYGLYDMAGNVWEWVQDWYIDIFHTSSLIKNPTGPASGTHRVIRGGSWWNLDYDLRVAHRRKYFPLNSANTIGFRCARSASTIIDTPFPELTSIPTDTPTP